MKNALLDSNVVIYAFSKDHRAARAVEIIEYRPAISVQTLNEFVNVARRKLKFDDDQIEAGLAYIITACSNVHALTLSTHNLGYRLSTRYRLHIYDALIVAVALEAGCDTLYSEDMQDGLVIEDLLTIRNPFG